MRYYFKSKHPIRYGTVGAVAVSLLMLCAWTDTALSDGPSLLEPGKVFDISNSENYFLKSEFLTSNDDDPDTVRGTEPVNIAGQLGDRDVEYLLIRNGTNKPQKLILYFHGTSVGIDGTLFREYLLKETGLPILLPGRAGYGNSEFVSLAELKLEKPELCGDRYHKLIQKLQNVGVLASSNLKIIAISMSGGGPCGLQFVEEWEQKKRSGRYRNYEVSGFIMQASFAHKWVTKTAISRGRLKAYIRQQLSSILDVAVPVSDVRTALENVSSPKDVRLNHEFNKIRERLDKIVSTNRGLFDNFDLGVVVAISKLRTALQKVYSANSDSKVAAAKAAILSSVERINKEVNDVQNSHDDFLDLAGFVAAPLRKNYGFFTVRKELLEQHSQEVNFLEADKTGRSIQLVSLIGYFNLFLKTIEIADKNSGANDPKGDAPTAQEAGGEVRIPSGSASDLQASARSALQNYITSRVMDKADLTNVPSNIFTEMANRKVIPFICEDEICRRLCLTKGCVAKGFLMEASRAATRTGQARHIFLYSLIGDAGLTSTELAFTQTERIAMVAALKDDVEFTPDHSKTIDEMFAKCQQTNDNSSKCILLNSANVMFEIGRRAKQSGNGDGREIDGLMFVGGITGSRDVIDKKISDVPIFVIHDITDPLVPFEHSAYAISTVFEKNDNVKVMCPNTAGHFLWSGRDAVAMHRARKQFISCNLDGTNCSELDQTINGVNSDVAMRVGLSDRLYFKPLTHAFSQRSTYVDYCK